MKCHHSARSQNARILRHMRQGYSIDPLRALYLFDSWALRSRICEIEGKSGHPRMLRRGEEIVRVPAKTRNGKRHMQYRLRRKRLKCAARR